MLYQTVLGKTPIYCSRQRPVRQIRRENWLKNREKTEGTSFTEQKNVVSYMRFMNSYGGLIMNNNEILLLKLGEVVLKGLNRRSFEDKLVSNVRRRMKPCGSFQIVRCSAS